MESVYVKARAKINLALDVLGTRGDGYHELDMVMQSVSLYDGLYIKKTDKANYVKVVSESRFVPKGDKNIVFRAVKFVAEKYGIRGGIFVKIDKNIPVSAGLGGGSADCAAALVGLNALYDLGISRGELSRIGLAFGADVPFCLMGGTARARGVGEILEKIGSVGAYSVLVKPPFPVSTGEIFQKFDSAGAVGRPNVEAVVSALRRGDLAAVGTVTGNALESVTGRLYPLIGEIEAILNRSGAVYSMMSGSGPTVFGVFGDRESAFSAAATVKKNLPRFKEIFVARFCDKGLRIAADCDII